MKSEDILRGPVQRLAKIARGREGAGIPVLVLAIMGALCLALFIAVLVFQYLEYSYYDAPPSVWVKPGEITPVPAAAPVAVPAPAAASSAVESASSAPAPVEAPAPAPVEAPAPAASAAPAEAAASSDAATAASSAAGTAEPTAAPAPDAAAADQVKAPE